MWPPTEDACREDLKDLEGTPLWNSLWPPPGFSGGEDPWQVRATGILRSVDTYAKVLQHIDGHGFDAMPPDTAVAFDMWMLDWRSADTFFLSRQVRDYVSAVKTGARENLLMMRDSLVDCINDTDFPWSDLSDVVEIFGAAPVGADPVLHHLYLVLENHGINTYSVRMFIDVTCVEVVGELDRFCQLPNGNECTYLEHHLAFGSLGVLQAWPWTRSTVELALAEFEGALLNLQEAKVTSDDIDADDVEEVVTACKKWLETAV